MLRDGDQWSGPEEEGEVQEATEDTETILQPYTSRELKAPGCNGNTIRQESFYIVTLEDNSFCSIFAGSVSPSDRVLTVGRVPRPP